MPTIHPNAFQLALDSRAMTPITDKIKQLPDGCPLFKAALPISEVPFYSDDLKKIVSELETAKRTLERMESLLESAVSIECWYKSRNFELRGMTGGSWRVWGGHTYRTVFDAFESEVEELENDIAQAALEGKE